MTQLNIGWLDLISVPKDGKKAKKIKDNNYYIEKAWNPISISKKDNPIVNEDDVYMFYSLGRTWSLRLKVDF